MIGNHTCSDLDTTWFDAWYDAYAAAEGTACRAEGLYLVDRTERIGPIACRVRASATNCHSVAYDAPADARLGGETVDALFAAGEADLLRFEYLDGGSRLLASARDWQAHRAVRIEPHAVAPLADCRQPYATWLAARSKRIRQRLKRDGDKVIDVCGMQFETHDGSQDLDTLIEAMLAVERSGWKGKGGTAIADDPADLRFYSGLAHRAARAGALRLATLRHAGEIVAFEYGVISGRRISLLKVGYDERFADLSLGYVMAALHIRHCCEDPALDWYDKMGNGMSPAQYKLRFADALNPLYRVTVYGRSPRGRLALAHDAIRAWAKRRRDAWRSRGGEPT